MRILRIAPIESGHSHLSIRASLVKNGVVEIVIATFRLPLYYDSALRVSGRPADRPWTSCHAFVSRFYVTLPWMTGVAVGLVSQTMGIDVTRQAESIGDVPGSWDGRYIAPLENIHVSRFHAARHDVTLGPGPAAPRVHGVTA